MLTVKHIVYFVAALAVSAPLSAQAPTFGRSQAAPPPAAASPFSPPSTTIYRQPEVPGGQVTTESVPGPVAPAEPPPTYAPPPPQPQPAPVYPAAQPPAAAYAQPAPAQYYAPAPAQPAAPTASDAYYGVPSANALPASDQRRFSLAVLGGYGVSFEDANPWAIGLGAAAGFNFERFYAGARFLYHFGTEETYGGLDSFGNFVTADSSINLWQLGGVVGYDVMLSREFALRPSAGIGVVTVARDTDSVSKLFVGLGATGIYDVSNSVFLGADAQLQLLFFDDIATGLDLLVTVGFRV